MTKKRERLDPIGSWVHAKDMPTIMGGELLLWRMLVLGTPPREV